MNGKVLSRKKKNALWNKLIHFFIVSYQHYTYTQSTLFECILSVRYISYVKHLRIFLFSSRILCKQRANKKSEVMRKKKSIRKMWTRNFIFVEGGKFYISLRKKKYCSISYDAKLRKFTFLKSVHKH